MKNPIRKLIAGILAVVTMIGAGAAVTASAETVDNQEVVITEEYGARGEGSGEVKVETEADVAMRELMVMVKEGLKQTDMTKPFRDGTKQMIDQMDIGKHEKQLLKELTDEFTSVTMNPKLYSMPGMSGASKLINAFDEAGKIRNSSGVEKLAHTVKSIENGIDAIVTLVPCGGYIIQGKETVKTVGSYVIDKVLDNTDEIVDTAKGAANTVVDGVKTAYNKAADGVSYAVDQVGGFFSGLGNKICSWF